MEPLHPSHIIAAAGGVTELARALKIDRTTPYSWGDRVPSHHVGRIAAITGIPLHKIRPDLFPAPQAGAAV